MPAERYYYPNELHEDCIVILENTEFHHLTNVMRAKEGDLLELVNGQGVLAQASVLKIEKKKAQLKIIDVKTESKPSFEIILAQSTPRINRLDTILEKGTELGMTQLWLFPGDFSERKILTEHQLERMTSITIGAMKQCGRLYLPQILLKPKLEQWERSPYSMFYGDVNPEAPKLETSLRTFSGDGLIIVIGPESGLSDKEELYLRNLKAQGVKLHPNILRTDTAAIAALALISHLKG